MSKSRKSVSSFADLMNLQAVQEIVCHGQAEEARAELAQTPVTETSTKKAQVDAMWEQRQQPRRTVSKAERNYMSSLYGPKRR